MESLSILEKLGTGEYSLALSGIAIIVGGVWKSRNKIREIWQWIFKPKPPPSPPIVYNISNCDNVTINTGNENKTAISIPPKVEGAGNGNTKSVLEDG